MRLERLELLNFCQHRHRVINFHEGLTAVIGPNGSGKSNLLGGLKWLLTGINPNPGPLEDNVCQLADKTERSMGTLLFSHGGSRIRLTRHLRPASKAVLEQFGMAGGPPLKVLRGEKEIGPWLEDFLGISFDIIKEMVIVSQDDIFAFLDLTPAKRAAAFQRLFRTEVAGELYDLIGKQLALVQPLPAAVSSGDCRINITQCEASLTSWESHASTLRPRSMVQSLRDTALKVIGNYEAYRGTKSAVTDEENRLAGARSRREGAAQTRDGLAARVSELTAARAGQSAVAAAAKASLANLAAARNIDASRRAVNESLAKCHSDLEKLAPPVPVPGYLEKAARYAAYTAARDEAGRLRQQLGQWTLAGLQVEVDHTRQELANLRRPARPVGYLPVADRLPALMAAASLLDQASKLVAEFADGKVVCPTCGTPAATLQAKIDEARRQLPELRSRVESLSQLKTACEQYDQAEAAYEPTLARLRQQEESLEELLAAAQAFPAAQQRAQSLESVVFVCEQYDTAIGVYQQRKNSLETALQHWSQQLAALPPATTTVVDEAALNAVIAADDGYAREIEQQQRLLNDRNNELSRVDGEISQIEQTLAQRRASLAQVVDVSEAEVAQAQEQVTQLDAELARIDEATSNVARARDSVRYWQQQLAVAEQFEATMSLLNKLRAYGGDLRDLFQHTNAPRFVAHRNLQRLQGTINTLLGVFQARYQVVPDQGLSFTGYFTDGAVQKADRFSHGEAVVLATAFRLANNLMFAEHIGLLALDEPTAWLDEHHIRGFEPVLQQLRGFAAARGLQCVIITHERSLAPLFDTVIAL